MADEGDVVGQCLRMIRVLGPVGVLLACVLMLVPGAGQAAAPAAGSKVTATYTNPLKPKISGNRVVENCPDPTVLRGRGAEAGTWYMFGTSDPLDDVDTSGKGGPVFHRLPMIRSKDLVHWTYVGPALAARPGLVARRVPTDRSPTGVVCRCWPLAPGAPRCW
jgi:arabinan endo-1,5-alpha-L-arabinosidase